MERIKVHSAAIEGNLEGESADRDVIVFLPPSYGHDTGRHYPVVYALHGYFIGAEQWTGEIHVPQTIEGAFAQGAGEMIVVLPDSKTVYLGSFYSSSATTGDFERFISHDLVAYIDAHYRTLPTRESRGLVGHSMGGYGASRIGMKHPDVFGALYIMSPCCLSPMAGGGPGPADDMKQRAIDSEKKAAYGEVAGRTRCRIARLCGRAVCHRGRVGARPEEPASLLRSAHQGRGSATGDRRQAHGQCAACLCGPVHRQSKAVSRHLDGRGRPGWTALRCDQTA